jgi:hypothetical protein
MVDRTGVVVVVHIDKKASGRNGTFSTKRRVHGLAIYLR